MLHTLRSVATFAATLAAAVLSQAQLTTVAPLPASPEAAVIPTITQPAIAAHPLTITGARGAILGEQSGVVELWQLPVKVFSNLHLKAQLDGYTVPIDLNPGASTLTVRPGHTVLTYSFAGITVRQHMLVSPAIPPSAPSSPTVPSSAKVGADQQQTFGTTGSRRDRASARSSSAGERGASASEEAQTPTFDDPGAILYFEIDSVRPATLTVTLTPNLQQMWPAPQYGVPGAGWTSMPDPGGPKEYPGGAYTIATDNPAVFGMVGMPRSRPGDIPVYQEHPQTLPLQFLVRYDPAVDKGRLFPLLSTVSRPGEQNSAAAFAAMQQRLIQQARDLPAIAAAIDSYYTHFFDTRLTAHTPDPRFDEALKWAALSIEDSQVEHRSNNAIRKHFPCDPPPLGRTDCLMIEIKGKQTETGLVAGWFGSYDSARPGFGWYFGRDTLWSLYAIDSYGDTALAKRALEFLLHRQRADGKMMHEFSQMADDLPSNIPWASFPYEYAAADATPLFLMALRDYVRTSGDTAFLAAHWEQVQRAWNFERAHDSDGDGVYDNSQGTGWVENWQSPMPHQELYLAALDAEASRAMADLATLQHDEKLHQTAIETLTHIQTVIETYRDPQTGLYAFSKNANGTFDRTTSVYPAVALWEPSTEIKRAGAPRPASGTWDRSPQTSADASSGSPSPTASSSAKVRSGQQQSPKQAGSRRDRASARSSSAPKEGALAPEGMQAGHFTLHQPAPMLDAWTSPQLATDWGTRAIITATSFFDPISYHMGSVWPLFTGWNAMAQYNAARPAAAWVTLQQNLRLTWAQDPGTVTEVLSGAFYQPMGRSSAHQLWSSAMTLAPAVRGLFGIQADATRNTLQIHPHLPVTWDKAELHHVRVGDALYTVTYTRAVTAKRPALHIAVTKEPNLGSATSQAASAQSAVLCLNLPAGAVANTCPVGITRETTIPLPAVEFALADDLTPQPGDETKLPHITNEHYEADRTTCTLYALAGTTVALRIRRNGTLDPDPEIVTMPAASAGTLATGYVTRTITIPLTGHIAAN